MRREAECACEYVLPDYMGDIKKMLSGKARVLPGGKFVSDGGVELTGTVEYEIMYADSENKLTAVNTSSDYSVVVPADAESYVGCAADCRVGNFAIRITGPRKMSLRSTVEVAALVTTSAEPEVSGDVFGGEREPQYISRNISVESAKYGKSLEREYAEEAERIGGVSSDEIEIIATGGSVRVFEAKPVEGGVLIKGVIVIGAIIRTPEQPPFAIRREIPFEETVEIEGVDKDMNVVADGILTSATVGISEDGEECVLSVNAIAEFEAYAIENVSVTVVSDAYLKECPTECKYADFEYTTLGACQINEVTISEKINRASIGCIEARELLMLDGEVKSYTVSHTQSGAEINGEIALSGIACEINVDNSVGYTPIKATVPFVANVNINCQIPENSRIECSVSVSSVEGLMDADDVHLKIALKIKSRLECVSETVCLVACNVSADEYLASETATPSHITVYYPTPSDTLFSVAKRFHSTPEKIACDNMLTESASATDSTDSLSGVRRLVIR
jgi:hypothetical protein